LNRKGGAPGRVAAPFGTQPTLFTKDHSGSHVSLFLIVSAGGFPVLPFALIHGPPQKFYDDSMSEFVKCYHTKRGYMTKFTFEKIMVELFVEYVKQRRVALGLPPTAAAAIVVDGHNSRYNARLLRILAENHIDMLILPAHTSSRLQPLDSNLNKYVKQNYRSEFPKALSRVIALYKDALEEEAKILAAQQKEEQKEEEPVLAPKAKRSRKNSSGSSTLRKNSQKKETKPKTPKELECERIAMVRAAVNSVQTALIQSNIESSWRATKLHPFDGTPPFTREKEKEEQKEIDQSGLAPSTSKRKKIVRLTGVVTTPEAIEQIALAEAQAAKGRIKAPLQKIEQESFVPDGPITKVIETCPSLDDVGDYIVLEDPTPVRRGRGRPPKEDGNKSAPKKKSRRSRGRPSIIVVPAEKKLSVPPKRPGRPRKAHPPPSSTPFSTPTPPPPRRCVGRPRKVAHAVPVMNKAKQNKK